MYTVAYGSAETGFLEDGYEAVYRVAVDYTDKSVFIYADLSDPGEGEGALVQSDLGDTDIVQWWGTYMGDGFSIFISNYDGNSFSFAVSNIRNGEYIYEGVAALDPVDGHMAVYEDIGFYLYEDFSTVDFLTAESSEWAHLRGQYTRMED